MKKWLYISYAYCILDIIINSLFILRIIPPHFNQWVTLFFTLCIPLLVIVGKKKSWIFNTTNKYQEEKLSKIEYMVLILLGMMTVLSYGIILFG